MFAAGRRGTARPAPSPVNHQHLLHGGRVSLLLLLLGWQSSGEQAWRALGLTNDSWGGAGGGLPSWGGHCENAPVCVLQEMKECFPFSTAGGGSTGILRISV